MNVFERRGLTYHTGEQLLKGRTISLLGIVCCALTRGVVVDRRVNLSAKQQYCCRDIEVKEQREGGAEAPVDNAVVGEVR